MSRRRPAGLVSVCKIVTLFLDSAALVSSVKPFPRAPWWDSSTKVERYWLR